MYLNWNTWILTQTLIFWTSWSIAWGSLSLSLLMPLAKRATQLGYNLSHVVWFVNVYAFRIVYTLIYVIRIYIYRMIALFMVKKEWSCIITFQGDPEPLTFPSGAFLAVKQK